MPALIERLLFRSPFVRGIGAWTGPAGALGVLHGYLSARDRSFLGPAQRAVDGQLDLQQPGTGWARQEIEEVSTSATSFALLPLALAASEGMDVDAEAFDGVDTFLREVSSDVSGEREGRGDWAAAPSESVGGGSSLHTFATDERMPAPMRRKKDAIGVVTVTELAAVARLAMGWSRAHPFLVGAANVLKEGVPAWMEPPENNNVVWPWPYLWIGAAVTREAGGQVWRIWGGRLAELLPQHQRLDLPEVYGSWDSDVKFDDHGRLFSTALACLVLESWYRLPLRPAR
jgi:hypothetical protein